MVQTRTECTRYNSNNSFGEIIDKLQVCTLKKHKDSLKKKKEKNLQNNKDSIWLNKTYIYIYTYNTGWPPKNRTYKLFFITPTKIKQNNSNSFPW